MAAAEMEGQQPKSITADDARYLPSMALLKKVCLFFASHFSSTNLLACSQYYPKMTYKFDFFFFFSTV